MVDILMATYNGEKFISEQLDSIINQDFKDWKLFIRDDGSRDNTLNIIREYLKKYPERIELIDNENKNLGAKLNFGELMKHSKNRYCMFSDQDDIWLSNKISITLKKMKHLELIYGIKKPILVHTDLKVVNQNLQVCNESYWNYMNIDPKRNTLNKALVRNTVTGCTMMINSSLRKYVQGIPKECKMHDHWLSLVASICGIVEIIYIPTILYRQHVNNQVGANKMNFFRKLIKNTKDLKYKFPTEQAEILYKDYNNFLSQKNNQILKEFIELSNYNFIKKRYVLLKNNYFTNIMLNRIKMFLCC